jgi:hypothetical protein
MVVLQHGTLAVLSRAFGSKKSYFSHSIAFHCKPMAMRLMVCSKTGGKRKYIGFQYGTFLRDLGDHFNHRFSFMN